MTTEKLLIPVVMGAYNQAQVLKQVLTAYQNQSLSPSAFEIIVVDSSSDDETPEVLNHFCAHLPLIYERIENKGKSRARNHGIHIAHAALVLVTDADIIPHPNLLYTHIEAHQAVGTPVVYEGLEYNMTVLHWPPEERYLYPTLKRTFNSGKRLHWGYCLTGDLSFPKLIFEQIGGFDETFVGYGFEDIEWGYRLSKSKIPLRYLAAAINYHYHLIDSTLELDRAKAKAQGAATFAKKHPEIRWFVGAHIFNYLFVQWLSGVGFFSRWLQAGLQYPKTTWRFKFSSKVWCEYQYLKNLFYYITKEVQHDSSCWEL